MEIKLIGATWQARDNKISSIKAFRDASGWGLKEAKDAVEDVFAGREVVVVVPPGKDTQLTNAGFNVVTLSKEDTDFNTVFQNFLRKLVDLEEYDKLLNVVKFYKQGGFDSLQPEGRRLET